jgi:hypothetical protein
VVLCPAEALLLPAWDIVSIVKMLSSSPVLPGTEDDYKRERLRVKERDTKWRSVCQASILHSDNSWAQVGSQCFGAQEALEYLLCM